MAGPHEYAFDITLSVAVRIKADNEAQARAHLNEYFNCADSNFGADVYGDPITAEASLAHEPSEAHLYEIDNTSTEGST